MSAVWPNLTHFRLWKVSLLKTGHVAILVCSRLVTYGIRCVNGEACLPLSVH